MYYELDLSLGRVPFLVLEGCTTTYERNPKGPGFPPLLHVFTSEGDVVLQDQPFVWSPTRHAVFGEDGKPYELDATYCRN